MSVLKEAPEGADVIDLDAARAARAEAAAGTPATVLKVSAGFIELRREVDVLAAEAFTSGQIREGLSKLLADPTDVDEIVKDGLSKADLQVIVTFITGNSLGE